MSEIDELIGNRITRVTNIEDYWQIETDSFVINILNLFKIYDPYKNIFLGAEYSLENMINKKITNIIYLEEKYFIIEFDRRMMVYIFIQDQYYEGPEAINVFAKKSDFMLVI